mgnify:FL=1
MFRFWTVQHKSVLDVVAMNGFYQADVSKSPFVLENPPREELYRFLLDAFNKANDFRLNGLIFGFAYREDSQIRSFQDILEFAAFLRQKRNIINVLWRRFCSDDYVILCLDYPEDSFNPLFIDMNDFQFLMPPITILPPFTYDSIARIVTDIRHACISPGELPSCLIQAHLPLIHRENITEVYRMFSLDA